MATLDDFVKTSLKPLNYPDRTESFENNFALHGGEAVIIDQTGNSRFFGLGIFSSILECYDRPVNSQESRNFQMMLDRPLHDYELFKSGDLMDQAIAGELITLSPTNETYGELEQATEQLYTAYNAFETALPEEIKDGNQFLPDIMKRIRKIKDSDSPETLMTILFKEGRGLAIEVNGYIPSWQHNCWLIEMPAEYQDLKSAYNNLRTAFRKGEYQLSVSDSLKDKQLIKRVEVYGEGVPIERQFVFITDTPEELSALASMQGDWKKNIVYRGPVNEKTTQVLDQLRKSNFIVCGQIRGPNDYRQYLRNHNN